MAKPLTEREVELLHDSFLLYDTVGDDQIDPEAFGEALRGLGMNPTEAEIRRCIGDISSDGQKRISFEEFLPIYQSFRQKARKYRAEDFMDSLRIMDKDGSGMISSAELRHLLMTLGDKLSSDEADKIIKEHEDKNGQVTYEDFVRAVLSG